MRAMMKLFRNMFAPKNNSEHHYAFAHIALRKFAFAEPVLVFSVLASPDRNRFFNDILADLHEQLQISTKCSFRGEDIEFFAQRINGRPCAILKMPRPTEPVEAHFIALVSRLGVEQLSDATAQLPAGELLDYFTFERPVVVESGEPTVFCGWSADDSHANYGDGPQADLESVIAFLTTKLRDREAS
jgi:hypothetical protein